MSRIFEFGTNFAGKTQKCILFITRFSKIFPKDVLMPCLILLFFADGRGKRENIVKSKIVVGRRS